MPSTSQSMTKMPRNNLSTTSSNDHTLQPGRPHQAQDLTPYSAVSSFNLPVHYDSSLITPVSSTHSPPLATKPAPLLRQNLEPRLSPTSLSPFYQSYSQEEDYEQKFNPPMKHKNSSGGLQISTADNGFPPGSPFQQPTEHYWGAYGVSAAPHSSRASYSPPTFQPSPGLQSAGGFTSSSHSTLSPQQPTSAHSMSGYRETPILIAPNPSNLRPATNQEVRPYRHHPRQSGHSSPYRHYSQQSCHSSPRSIGSVERGQTQFTMRTMSLPTSSKKPKKKKSSSSKWGNTPYNQIPGFDELDSNTRILLELSNPGPKKLAWKILQVKYREATGEDIREETLQMRKKRALDKLWSKAKRIEEESAERNNWKNITNTMHKYSSRDSWSPEAAQRRWNELNQAGNVYSPGYDVSGQQSRPRATSDAFVDHRSWSDSPTARLEDGETRNMISALSSASMEDARSRTASDASLQMIQQQQQQIQQQQMRQQEMIYEQRRQILHQGQGSPHHGHDQWGGGQ